MKRKSELIIVTFWALLYAPYILYGGLLRDDLKRLTIPLGFTNYLDFQWYISSHINMTARPVSAILHGLCYWNFGTSAWLFHITNLTLFCGSVLFFYLFLKTLASRNIALFSALFALVYPCASGTLFSSMMMNSNLAAFFWSAALYISTKNFKGKYLLTTLLLLLSSLSYEAFIPLFALNIIFILIVLKPDNRGLRQAVIETLPILVALALYSIYRGYIEKIIFETNFSRINIFSPKMLFYRFFASLMMGVRIAFLDSFRISLYALRDLGLTSAYYLTLASVFTIALGAYLYKNIFANTMRTSENSIYVRKFIKQDVVYRIDKFLYLDLSVFVVVLFFCAHFIFVFSTYMPDPTGFENRTLGGIRFVTALSMTIFAKAMQSIFKRGLLQKTAILSTFGLFIFFTFSIIGQREAWIAAARYNAQTLSKMNAAIHRQHLSGLQQLTLVAVLPSEFPGQVNQEPIFGTPWDITPSLALSNPATAINANVYNSKSTSVGAKKVVIDILGNHWEATYPFWLYKFEDDRFYQITSEQDWRKHIQPAH